MLVIDLCESNIVRATRLLIVFNHKLITQYGVKWMYINCWFLINYSCFQLLFSIFNFFFLLIMLISNSSLECFIEYRYLIFTGKGSNSSKTIIATVVVVVILVVIIICICISLRVRKQRKKAKSKLKSGLLFLFLNI